MEETNQIQLLMEHVKNDVYKNCRLHEVLLMILNYLIDDDVYRMQKIEEQLEKIEENVIGHVQKLSLIHISGNRMEAICFHDAQEFAERCERNNGKMSITFYPGINEFRGERQIQIVICLLYTSFYVWFIIVMTNVYVPYRK